jgi:hypothetical protein
MRWLCTFRSVRLDDVEHALQRCPFVRFEIATRTLFNADENVARQQPISDLRKLPWFGDR